MTESLTTAELAQRLVTHVARWATEGDKAATLEAAETLLEAAAAHMTLDAHERIRALESELAEERGKAWRAWDALSAFGEWFEQVSPPDFRDILEARQQGARVTLRMRSYGAMRIVIEALKRLLDDQGAPNCVEAVMEWEMESGEKAPVLVEVRRLRGKTMGALRDEARALARRGAELWQAGDLRALDAWAVQVVGTLLAGSQDTVPAPPPSREAP